MTYDEVMKELELLGTEQNRRIYKNHGNDIDMFGVSVANLKKLYKRIKDDNDLGRKLLNSKNSDAIYLSQWLVDPSSLTITDLELVMEQTNFYMILDNTIPNMAIGNKNLTWECIESWIDHNKPRYRQVAYSLYALVLSKYPNEDLNINQIKELLKLIESTIHQEENRVRYSMNGFVISAGIYIPYLTDYAILVGKNIGKVKVFMGNTSCKVPYAPDYIDKVKDMDRIGKKR